MYAVHLKERGTHGKLSDRHPQLRRATRAPPGGGHDYPLTFAVDYPDRSLNRVSTAFRIFTIIPIAILAATLEGGSFGASAGESGARYAGGGIGILVIPVLLMLLFRKKYPRWWYDWNLQLSSLQQPDRRLLRADGRPLPVH